MTPLPPDSQPIPSRPGWRIGGGLPWLAGFAFVFGVVVRIAYILLLHDPRAHIYSDMQFYCEIGERLSRSDYLAGPGDVTHPPAMGAVICFFNSHGGTLANWFDKKLVAAGGFVTPPGKYQTLRSRLTNMVVLQLLLSILAPLAIAMWARAMFDWRAAWMALGVASVYFPFIDYFGYFLAEGYVILLIPLILGLIAFAARAKEMRTAILLSLAAGVLWSVGMAFKLVLLPGVLAFLLVMVVMWEHRPTWRRSAALLLAIFIGATPLMVVVSNHATHANIGKRVLVSSKNGADFLLGHYGRIRGIYWRDPNRAAPMDFRFGSPSSVQRGYSEVATVNFTMTDSVANKAAAWKWIGEHPFDAFVLSCEHVYDAFLNGIPWPSSSTQFVSLAQFFHFLYAVFLFVPSMLAIALVWKDRGLLAVLRSTEFLIACPLLGVAASVFATIGELRYRIPWDAAFILLAIHMGRQLKIRLSRATTDTSKPQVETTGL